MYVEQLSRKDLWDQLSSGNKIIQRDWRLSSNKKIKNIIFSKEGQDKIIQKLQNLVDFDIQHKTEYSRDALAALNLHRSTKRIKEYLSTQRGQADIIKRMKELIEFDIKYDNEFASDAMQKFDAITCVPWMDRKP